jgi:hypothetical protein
MWWLLVVGALRRVGVWPHLSDRRVREHTHEVLEHEHRHVHDEHHQPAHDDPVADNTGTRTATTP